MRLLEVLSNIDEDSGPTVLMRQHLKEGVGSDLMTYIDFANATHWKAHLRQKYDELAHALLARGFSTQPRPSVNRLNFVKRALATGTSLDDEVTIVTINSDLLTFTSVGVHIVKGPLFKRETFDIDELVGPGADLDFILSGQDH